MKKFGQYLVLGALSLSLVACGGNASSTASSAATSSSETTSAATSSATSETTVAKATFVGDWKCAAIQAQGVTMTGDISQIMSMIGEETGSSSSSSLMDISLKEDGTGSLTMAGTTVEGKWAETTTGAATFTPVEGTEGGTDPVNLTLEDNALIMTMDTETATKAIFTADGTYEGVKAIDLTAATAVKSEDELVGSWALTGVKMMGISMSGDAKTLSEMANLDAASLAFEAGGKGTMFGESVKYTVDDKGASIDADGTAVSLKMLDKDLVVDMGDVLGIEMALVFSKA